MELEGERRAPGWLGAPLHSLSPRGKWALASGMTVLTAVWSGFAQRWFEPPFAQSDTSFYIALAKGNLAALQQPFASRPLAPLLVRGIVALTHLSFEAGFTVLGWVSLLVTMGTVYALLMRTAAPRWMVAMVATVPFWPQLLHALPMPDLPYAALLCGLLWCLAAKRPLTAALLFFPLTLARESTSLVLVCLLAAGWRQLRPRGCVVAVLAALAGAATVRHLTAGAAGNVEHLPPMLYMMGKLPWNLLRTLGVDPWSNLYPYLCATPVWQRAVHLGPLEALGVCRTSRLAPSESMSALLTTFGVLPVLLLALVWRGEWRGEWRERWRGVWGRAGVLTRFCLLYGLASLALAPMLGTAYPRLFGYPWPLWLVGLPALFPVRAAGEGAVPRQARDGVFLGVLLGLQVALGWLAFPFPYPWVLALEAGLQGASAAALWRWWKRWPEAPESGAAAPFAW